VSPGVGVGGVCPAGPALRRVRVWVGVISGVNMGDCLLTPNDDHDHYNTYSYCIGAFIGGGLTNYLVAGGIGKAALNKLKTEVLEASETATTRAAAEGAQQAARVGALFDDAVGVANARSVALQELLPAGSRGRVTMSAGVVEDAAGNRVVVVATSEPNGYLRPGVREAIGPDEIVVAGTGHAEADIVAWADANGYQVIAVGAGRLHCESCVATIEGAGGTTASPRRGP